MITAQPSSIQNTPNSEQDFENSQNSNKSINKNLSNMKNIKRLDVIDYPMQNGIIYSGELQNNKRNGSGIAKYPNKDRYQGTFINNYKHGKGKYYYHSGQYYIGDWVLNKKEGAGLYIYDKDKWYEGEFKDNMKHGKGVIKETNGNYYSGFFWENKKDQDGVYYNALEDKILRLKFDKGIQLSISEVPSQEEVDKIKKQTVLPTFVTQKSLIQVTSQKIVSEILQNYIKQQSSLIQNVKTTIVSLYDSNEGFNKQYLKKREEINTSKGPQIKNEKLKGIKIVEWEIEEICEWLGEIGFGDFITQFRYHNLTGLGLINLNQENLKELNIVSEEDRKLFLMEIQFLRLFFKTQCIKEEIYQFKHEPFDLGLLINLAKQDGTFLKKHQSYIEDIHDHFDEGTGRLKSFNSLKKQIYEPKKIELENLSNINSDNVQINHQAEEEPSSSTQSSAESVRDNKAQNEKQQPINQKIKRHSQIHKQIQLQMRRKRIDTKFVIPNSQIQLIKSIGKGSYGQVYLGTRVGQQVAVKLYTKRKGIRNRHISRFLQQAQITIKLLHPFIVLYMGIFVYDNDYALVMEYMQGGSLFDYLHIKGYKPSESKIICFCKKIAMAMTYLHGKRIIHCDLKSSNLLLDQSEKIKISDFGLSQIKRENHRKKCRLTRLGAPHWMAPEVMKFGIYDFSSDVYSFGIVLWEMLSGEIPFRQMTEKQVIKQANKPEGLSLKIPNSQCDKLIELFVACTQKQAEKRPNFNQIVNFLTNLQKQFSKFSTK